MSDETAFKHWINQAIVKSYVTGLKKSCKNFDASRFLQLTESLEQLELKARVRLIAAAIHTCTGEGYEGTLKSVMAAVKSQKIEGFALWPATQFIQEYGPDAMDDHFDASFAAMEILTPLFTAEFAVRPFIIKDQTRALKRLHSATKSDNKHLRRWASEGSRPRLPWGERLHSLVKDPSPALKILEQLKFDPELYVRKSVSNHLNDIAKDHPKLVVATLTRWKKSVPKNFEKEFAFILKQSLRTLIKNGDAGALQVLGIKHANPDLSIEQLSLGSQTVKMGGAIEFSFEIKNRSPQSHRYVVDYIVWHKKANQSLTPKVFKLKAGKILGDTKVLIKKKHSFKQITTRDYHPGEHALQILINGKPSVKKKFTLMT